MYFVHKDMEKALTPPYIIGANNLHKAGFQSFPHALKFYKQEYFLPEWNKIALAVEKEPQKALELAKRVEEKIGLSLMSPMQEDSFTQNLAIVNRYNNQKLSAYGIKNVIDKRVNEAERQSRSGGLSGQQLMTYAFAFVLIIGVIVFGLILLNATGMHVFGGGTPTTTPPAPPAPTTTPFTPTTVIPHVTSTVHSVTTTTIRGIVNRTL
jgi:hypothetical protein